ncbi:MAG: hypothetical protein V2I36_01255 [Desulfopila sp.]|nr:hypothetical protein [Desulfopila sp.]
METAIAVESDGLVLEALLGRIPGDRGVIVTHPHTLYGGNMYNPVVESVCSVYRNMEFSTLRFNFRGAGGSGGRFDDGQGERRDVLSMLDFCRDSGISTIHLVGYSFGAWVLGGIKDMPVGVVAQIHIAPPVAFMDYSKVGKIPRLKLALCGEYDDIGPPSLVEERLHTWNRNARLRVVRGGDHFFSTTMNSFTEILSEEIP